MAAGKARGERKAVDFLVLSAGEPSCDPEDHLASLGEQPSLACPAMKYHCFEDLKVWQRGCDLAVEVYEALRESRDYGFRDQMIRSSLSVPSNVAEGAERGSDTDFVRFLHYSKGSAGELRTQAQVAARVGVLSKDQAERIVGEAREIGAMLQGLIGTVRS